MKTLITYMAWAAGLAIAFIAAHQFLPIWGQIVAAVLLALAYAVPASRDPKHTVSQHLHMTAGRLILSAFSGALKTAGGVAGVVGIILLGWAIWHPNLHHAKDQAAETARTAVRQEAGAGVKGAVGDLGHNLGGAWERTKAHRQAREQQKKTAG